MPAQARQWIFFVAAVMVAIRMGIGKSHVEGEDPTAKWAIYATNILNNIVVLLLYYLPKGPVRDVAEYVRDTGPQV